MSEIEDFLKLSLDGWMWLDVIVSLMFSTGNVGHCFSRQQQLRLSQHAVEIRSQAILNCHGPVSSS